MKINSSELTDVAQSGDKHNSDGNGESPAPAVLDRRKFTDDNQIFAISGYWAWRKFVQDDEQKTPERDNQRTRPTGG